MVDYVYFDKLRLTNLFWIFVVEGPLTLVLLYYLFSGPFAGQTSPDSDVARLVWVIQRLFVIVLPKFLFLWGAMRAFDTNPNCEDSMAGVESDRWKLFQKILTNNTEQAGIFIPAILSLSVLVPDDMWPLMPTFLYTFAMGRLIYGIGYLFPPFPKDWRFAPLFTLRGWGRSPGFNLTLYPTTFALVFCYYYLYGGGSSSSSEL